tara:strand:- start:220 stop:474 length:255 start_codon:yes stop_codon:yes gene_type:complete
MTDEEAVLKEVEKVANDVDRLYLDLCKFFQEKVVPPSLAVLAMAELCEHILKNYQEIEKTEGLTSEVQDKFVKHKLLVDSEAVH